MGRQDDLNSTNNVSDNLQVAEPDHSESNPKSELTDEQLAKISGGPIFYPNGGSGDTSITPVPTAPGSTPSMP